MKNYKAIIILTKIMLFLLYLIPACSDRDYEKRIEKNDYKGKPKGIGVVLTDKTVMRLDPSIYSSVVTYLNKGEELLILDKSSNKSWLGNDEYYWYKARFSRGFSGWVYGKNIKIFSEDDESGLKEFLSEFWNSEHKKLIAEISGIWRSIKIESRYPEQYLEIYDNERYKSYLSEPDDETKIIEGKYTVNYKDNEIIFQNGTLFGTNLYLTLRENRLFLVKDSIDKDIKFKKISRIKPQ